MIPIKNNSLTRPYNDETQDQEQAQQNYSRSYQQRNNLVAVSQALQTINQEAQRVLSSEKTFRDELRAIVFPSKQINSSLVVFSSSNTGLNDTFEQSFYRAITVLIQTLVTISTQSVYRADYEKFYLGFFTKSVIPRKIPLLSESDTHITNQAARISKFQIELLNGLFNALDYLPNTTLAAGNRYALYLILKKVLTFSNCSENEMSNVGAVIQELFKSRPQLAGHEVNESLLHQRQDAFEIILNLCVAENGVVLRPTKTSPLQTQISKEFELLNKLKSFSFQQSVTHLDYLASDLNLFSGKPSEFNELETYRNTLIRKVKDLLPRGMNDMNTFSSQTMIYIKGEYKCVLFFNEYTPEAPKAKSFGHIFQEAFFQEFLKQYNEIYLIKDAKVRDSRFRILGSIIESCNFVINIMGDTIIHQTAAKNDYLETYSVLKKSPAAIPFFNPHIQIANTQKLEATNRSFKINVAYLSIPTPIILEKATSQQNVLYSLDKATSFKPKPKPSSSNGLEQRPLFFENSHVSSPIEEQKPSGSVNLDEKNLEMELTLSELEEKALGFSPEDLEFAKAFNKKLFDSVDLFFGEEKRAYKAIKEFIFAKGQGYWFIPLLLANNDETYESRSIHQIQKKLIQAIFRTYTSASENHVTKYVLYTFCKCLNFTITEEAQRTVKSYSKRKYLENFLPSKASISNTQAFMRILELAINEKNETNNLDISLLVPLNRIELKERAQAALFYLKFNQLKRWKQASSKEKSNLDKTLHGLMLIDSNERTISGYDMQLKLQSNGNIESFFMGVEPPVMLTMSEIEILKEKIQKQNLSKSIDGGLEANAKFHDFIFDPAMMQLPYDQFEGNNPDKSSRKFSLDHVIGSHAKGQAPSLPSGQSSQRIVPMESTIESIDSVLQKNKIVSSSSRDRNPDKRPINITFEEIIQKPLPPTKQNEASKTGFISSLEQLPLDDTFESFIVNISNRCLKSCSGRLQKRHGVDDQTQPLSYGIIDKLKSIDMKFVESIGEQCTFPYQIAKEYQLTALKALKVFQALKINTVIGWAVGTGKTHLIIGEILQKITTSENGSFLICAPFSLIDQTKESVITHFSLNRLLLLKNKLTKNVSRQQTVSLLETLVNTYKKEPIFEAKITLLKDLWQSIHNKIAKNRSSNEAGFTKVKNTFNNLPLRNKISFNNAFNLLEALVCDFDSTSPETLDELFNQISKIELSANINKNFAKTVLSAIAELLGFQELGSQELGSQDLPESQARDPEVITIEHLFSIDPKTLVTASNSPLVIKNAIESFSSPYNIVITTPDALCKLKNEVESIRWSQLFFDEAHLIARNSSSKKWQKLRPIVQTLLNHEQETAIRLLTATPFQGQISDLFNLMAFTHKEEDFSKETYKKLIKQLGLCQRSLNAFSTPDNNQKKSKQDIESKAIKTIIEAFAHFQVFKKIANTCIYQLKKNDPKVVEAWGGKVLTKKFHDNNYKLTPQQEERIKPFHSAESLKLSLEGSCFFSVDYALDALLLHPQIPVKNNPDGTKNTEIKAQQEALLMRISRPKASGGMNDSEFNEFINESGFLKAFFESTKDYVLQKKRWITFVDQIFHGKFLAAVIKRKFSSDRLDTSFFSGEAHAEQRTRIISEFKKENNKAKCMLMTIQAGGVGLNIPGVDVHLLAKPWDPSCEEQAIGRSDRVGNSGEISVHRYKNPDLDKRYTEIVESKKAWESYLTTMSEDLISQFDSFFDLISLYLVSDSDKDENKIDKDILKTIQIKIHNFIASNSPNNATELLQNYIDTVSPQGLSNFLKIQEVALRAIQNSSIIASRCQPQDEKQPSSKPASAQFSAQVSAQEKIPAAKVSGVVTITTPEKSPSGQLITPNNQNSQFRLEQMRMEQAQPQIPPIPSIPKKVPFYSEQQPIASSSNTPSFSPSGQKRHSPSSLPSKVSFRDDSSNTVSNFDVILLHQSKETLDNALQFAVADLQVRLRVTPELKTLNTLIQEFRKEHQKPNVQPILDESKKAGIVYRSVEECQKAGFQVELYELDKMSPIPSLKKSITYLATNPKETKGTVRLLATKENNHLTHSVLLRSR